MKCPGILYYAGLHMTFGIINTIFTDETEILASNSNRNEASISCKIFPNKSNISSKKWHVNYTAYAFKRMPIIDSKY